MEAMVTPAIVPFDKLRFVWETLGCCVAVTDDDVVGDGIVSDEFGIGIGSVYVRDISL